VTWFKGDDRFYRHPKVRKLGKDRLPAVGLWALCGTWCADNLITSPADGFVPYDQITQWDPKHRYAKRLVEVGLWKEVDVDGERGYLFHDWADCNPTRAEIEAEREEWRKKKAAQRKGRRTSVSRGVSPGDSTEDDPVDNSPDSVTKRSTSTVTDGPTDESVTLSTGDSLTPGEQRGKQRNRATSEDRKVSPRDSNGESRESPGTRSRPRSRHLSGAVGEGGATLDPAGSNDPPPPRCPEHLDEPTTAPCRKCGDARRANQAWHADQESRQLELAAALNAARQDPRQRCEHGTDGGRYIRPDTDTSPCAFCRTESTRDTG
jgi:hypothetical protein